MILAIHGGLYVDTNCECRRPFDFIQESDDLIVAPELQTSSAQIRELYNTPRSELFCVWALLSRPGHPLWFELIDEVVARLGRTLSENRIVNLIDQSGPGAFTDVFRRYLDRGGRAHLVPGPTFGCANGSSLFQFARSFMFPELFRDVYVRHRSQASWVDPKMKRQWFLRSLFFIGPPQTKPTEKS
ncbi:MAG: hypothetical protein J6386_26090 [Candidatus Synoicihabitans palmerolidicus]|nr:hypothetical protein [Candidatus Synoicihabitans palmerolidicus]MCC5025894.1 hypothetical protein [Candidatus Synoicihabitans palmerolidicus]MCC5025935.1 hypothetical protein [Candidatus Synoicihabitans palmerolidicus]MCC5025974.1 hypothetical protein [Candidatus Synoicihabitans palmerolidicus]MCC5026018.1 hypothetical protein [Candidatus Synoicihabitans palmerolidicus]